MATTVAQLAVSVSANTSEAEQNLGNITALLSHTGPLFLGLAAVAAVAIGVGVAATKMAGDFQAGMTTIVTGAGESASNLGMLSQAVLKMAVDTGTSTSQLVSGLYMIESANIHGAAALNILQVAAEGAKVGQADLGTVADAVTTVMKDYPGVMNGAAGAMNILIATVANGKTHMQDLASSLSTVLPAASALGIPLQDIMAAMATMTAQGTGAAQAATYLRMTLLMLEAPSAAAKKALNDAGLTTQEVADEMKVSMPDAINMITSHLAKEFPKGSAAYVAALKDIVGGTRSMQGILELTSKTGMKDFQSDLGKITAQAQKGGNSIVGWNLVQGTFNQKMSEFGEVIETTFIKLGTQMLPALTRLVGVLATDLPPAITWLTNAFGFVQQHFTVLAPVIGIVAGVIGGVLAAALWGAAVAAWGFLAPMLVFAAPFIAVGIAIGALIGVIVLLVTHWHQVENVLQVVVQWLQNVGTTISSHVMPILQGFAAWLWSVFGPAITNISETVKQLISWFQTYLMPVLRAVAGFLNATLVPAFKWVATTTINEVVADLNILGSVFKQIILPLLGDVASFLVGQLGTALRAVVSILGLLVSFLASQVGNEFKAFGEILHAVTSDIGRCFQVIGALVTAIKSIAGAVGGAIGALKNLANVGGGVAGILSHIPGFATGGTMPTTGLAVVGEAGPELLQLPGSTKITPLSGTSAIKGPPNNLMATPLSGTGSNSQPVQITIHLDSKVLAQATVRQFPAIIRNATGTRSF